MDDQTLQNGFTQLDTLSHEEYHEALQDIASEPNPQRSAVRIGRLIGVMLKEPFATSESLAAPSYRTGAYRAWHLDPPEQIETPEKTKTWQYQTLEQMLHELAVDESRYESMSVSQLVLDAQYETGFFGYFARTLRKYICGDPEIRKKIETAIRQANSNRNIPVITPEIVVGSSGLALGVYLVQTIPILGMVGAPVIAAVVVILYTLGVNAFCEWSANLLTNEDEKY